MPVHNSFETLEAVHILVDITMATPVAEAVSISSQVSWKLSGSLFMLTI